MLAFITLARLPAPDRFFILLYNAGHAAVFGAIAWIVLALLSRRRPAATIQSLDFLAAFTLSVMLGILVELIQSVIGRDAEVADVLTDAAGAGFVLCSLAARRGRTARRHTGSAWLWAGAAAAALFVAVPLAVAGAAYLRREEIFPALLRFAGPLDLYFVRGVGIAMHIEPVPAAWRSADARGALRVLLSQDDTPGLHLVEPAPDWRGYRLLSIAVINPGDATLHLVVRVHDRQHNQQVTDRFKRLYVIPAHQRTRIEIPVRDIENAPRGRRMDMSHIAGIVIFDPDRPAPIGAAFYVEAIRLEK